MARDREVGERQPLILSGGSLFAIAPEVHSLDIVGMVVSPRPSHSPRIDVIGHDVAVAGERHLTDGALPALFDDFAVEQLPHLCFRTEFAISPGVMQVFDPLHPKTSHAASLLDRLAPTAIEGSVDGAEFLATEFHELSPSALLMWIGNEVLLWFLASNAVRNYLSSHLAAHASQRLY
jgi:hypothetical protein